MWRVAIFNRAFIFPAVIKTSPGPLAKSMGGPQQLADNNESNNWTTISAILISHLNYSCFAPRFHGNQLPDKEFVMTAHAA